MNGWQWISKRRASRALQNGLARTSDGSTPNGQFSAQQPVRLMRPSHGLGAGAEGRIMGYHHGSLTVLVHFGAKLVQVRRDDIEPLQAA